VARRKACVWRAAKHHRPAACAPRNFDAARCEHNKFPPTPRVGLVRRRMFSKRRIAQLSFFFLRRSFSRVAFCSGVCIKRRTADTAAPTTRMRWTGQIFWLLALPRSRLHPRDFRGLAQWEVVSSYSSATAPDSHGISCADPLFQARKELRRGLAACALRVKII
jgi:hypothetical protein